MGFRIERNVPVSMRDGVQLATDVWIPDATPAPALLARLPYDKDILAGGTGGSPIIPNFMALLDAGYAVVLQDCRGTFSSGGEFRPVIDETHDGVDTIAWLDQQPWYDGTVGMFGASYFGVTQWAAASQSPDGLKAIAPATTSTDTYRAPWRSPGGAASWHTVWAWSTMMGAAKARRALTAGSGTPAEMLAIAGTLAAPHTHLSRLPLADQPALSGAAPWLQTWLDHPDWDKTWQTLAVQPKDVTVPALHIGGWFDIFVAETLRDFVRMRAEGGSDQARAGQRLIIGPWDHLSRSGEYRDRQFGISASAQAADITGAHLRFFDRWVRGATDAQDDAAPVRIFVMGIDQWRDEREWPLPDTTYVDYFLGGSGRADADPEDGVLSPDRPTAEAADTYVYEPADPVPSQGGRMLLNAALNTVGPVDRRSIEERADVLCFTTPTLEEPVEVTGHVSLVLHARTSVRDTDFIATLVDVFPDGRAIYLTDGILRARYRNSLSEPELLEPDQVYEFILDVAVTSNVFLPGHRIRLEVSSSDFPRYDRNTNTGGDIAHESAEQAVVATTTVLHGPDRPSRLVLPVIRH